MNKYGVLFLTSKVRLHCDLFARPGDGFYGPDFS